jgi:hypothetical protein
LFLQMCCGVFLVICCCALLSSFLLLNTLACHALIFHK